MACEFIKQGDGVTVIACGPRGRRRKPRCAVVGCTRPSTRQCDYPLAGLLAGKTCDRNLCDGHAQVRVKGFAQSLSVRIELARGGKGSLEMGEAEFDSKDYCPPHAKLVDRAEGG